MSTVPENESTAPQPPAPPPTDATPEDSPKNAPKDTSKNSQKRSRLWLAACFLLPALLLLGALVVYPIGYSAYRSAFDAAGTGFVGLENYGEVFSNDVIRKALQNTVIWVLIAPAVATALGLIFAVLTERIRWSTAFKLVIFMPMAISMLAAGIIFRLVYEQDPDQGVANAVVTGVHDTFAESSPYPGARPRPTTDLVGAGEGFRTEAAVSASDVVYLPLVGIPPRDVEGAPQAATEPEKAEPGEVRGIVWNDFTRGGGGEDEVIERGEKGLGGIKVEAVRDGSVVASTTTADDGTFTLPKEADGAQLRLPGSNFAAPYNGVDWLGPTLVTPAIIGSYVWMWAGFAMVLIAAGLAGVPREMLEAARVDGANEWQVFRKITVPLLAPVLAVVLVTLMINVLKIFDLVYIIAPGASQEDANVLALQLYLSSFGTGSHQGVGSAIAILLLLLVIPMMVVNIRRMRKEGRR